MTSLLSLAEVDELNQLRIAGWETNRALAEPQIDLVLVRSGVTQAAQAVVAAYPARLPRQQRGVANTETQADVVFRRPIDFGFDVEIGDRFAIADGKGVISRVYHQKGMVYAEATLDAGTV